ncbi:MAG: transposase, partial [Acidobacteriota bacterium]
MKERSSLGHGSGEEESERRRPARAARSGESVSHIQANQLRLWLSSVAYNVLHLLRILGLEGTERARAQCATIRQKLLKIGAQVRISVRRVLI